jgi:hypoxanthine-guanine phosphoribosyltransferase
VDYVLIPEGLLKDRIERLAQKIYRDAVRESFTQLDLLIIMNSAFKFFADLINYLNKESEKSGGSQKLKIRTRFVKITTQHLNQGVVDYEQVSVRFLNNPVVSLGQRECF